MARQDGIPESPIVHPNGRCYCGGDEIPKPGKFFVFTHDRPAEARVIHERFGNFATFVVWAETHLPKIES